jgi:hypothetical protein
MKKNMRYILAVVGLAVLAFMIMDFNSRVSDLTRLSRDREVVAAQVTEHFATQAALQTQVAYATSEAYVIERSYEQERLVRPGDVLIVPIAPGGSTPVPASQPAPTPVLYSNWQFWYALFFGRQP